MNRKKSPLNARLSEKIIGKKTAKEENVIPMINVIFLLLLYFMVVGNLSPDYNVNPPLANQEAESSTLVPTVSVTKDGELRFENQPVKQTELTGRLRSIGDYEKIKIYADAESDALMVSEIMKAAADVGILKFILVTQKKQVDEK